MAIDLAIRADRWPDDKVLARDLEVDRRTIRRDLEYMRNTLHAPIAFDRVRRGYWYAEPTFRLPTFLLNQGDLIDEWRDRILWDDRDYLAGDVFLDLDPAVGDALREQLGIEDDDSSAAPVEPTRAGLQEILASLCRICGRPLAWGGDAVVRPDKTNAVA